MNKVKTKNFSNFSVQLKENKTAKKKLSNSLSITFRDDSSEITKRIPLREARALKNWLNKNVQDSEKISAQ
jgi:hypothetical protein